MTDHRFLVPRAPLLIAALSFSLWLLASGVAAAATPEPPAPSPTLALPTATRATPTPIPSPTPVYLTNTPRPTRTHTPTPIATNTFYGAVEATAQITHIDPVAAALATPSATRTARPTSANPAAEPTSVFGSAAAWIPPAQEDAERLRLTAVEARTHPTVTPTVHTALAEPIEPTRTTEQVLGSNIPSRMKLSGPVDGSANSSDASSGARAPSRGPVVPPPPIRYAGVPAQSTGAGWTSATTLWLAVPHRSQFDGSVWAPTDCGPASLAMVLGAYGLTDYPTVSIRGEVNRLQGNSDPDSGTSLYAIASVAQRAGLYPMGLGKSWTLADVRAALAAGRPIITLTRYADLPGNGGFDPGTNHYIVLSGLSGDNIIYNDPAYSQGAGRGLLISPDALLRAWANSDWPGQSVAFALNQSGAGLMSPLAMRHHLSLSGDEDFDDDEDVDVAAVQDDLDPGIAAQREFYWKVAILGITNQPLAHSEGEDLAQGQRRASRDGSGSASPVDPPFDFSWSLLSIVILALIAASVPLTFAFMRLNPSPGD